MKFKIIIVSVFFVSLFFILLANIHINANTIANAKTIAITNANANANANTNTNTHTNANAHTNASVIANNISVSENKECNHDAVTFRCVKYIRNYDADTVTFDIPNVHPLLGDHISVRVRHVDTPEIKGKLPCEKEAARTAKNLIENLLKNAKRIDLANVDKDKYFRILADVIVDGRSLKDLLLKNNLAYAYEGKTKEKINWCKRVSNVNSL